MPTTMVMVKASTMPHNLLIPGKKGQVCRMISSKVERSRKNNNWSSYRTLKETERRSTTSSFSASGGMKERKDENAKQPDHLPGVLKRKFDKMKVLESP